MGRLLGARGDESAVARAVAGFNGDAVGDVEVVLAIEDENRVGAEVVDNKEAAAGVKKGLMGIWVRCQPTYVTCVYKNTGLG